jgi:hypothetical protein
VSTLALAADERVAEAEAIEDELRVRLTDGSTFSVPLVWYPRLSNAPSEQKNNRQLPAAQVFTGKMLMKT